VDLLQILLLILSLHQLAVVIHLMVTHLKQANLEDPAVVVPGDQVGKAREEQETLLQLHLLKEIMVAQRQHQIDLVVAEALEELE
tara:strand:+ start:293 stop:547 length:255 start_codon:yes stop_codon:yes gene_type:complete